MQRSATLLGLLILLSFLFLGLPAAITGPVLGGEWTRAGKLARRLWAVSAQALVTRGLATLNEMIAFG